MTMRARVDEARASVSLCQAGFHNVHNEKLKAKATVGKYRPGDARAVSLTGRSYTYGTQVADANRYMAAVAVGPQLVTFSVGGRAPSSLSNLAIEQPLACPERATSAARHDR